MNSNFDFYTIWFEKGRETDMVVECGTCIVGFALGLAALLMRIFLDTLRR